MVELRTVSRCIMIAVIALISNLVVFLLNRWVNGAPFYYVLWARGEPTGSGNAEMCAQISNEQGTPCMPPLLLSQVYT